MMNNTIFMVRHFVAISVVVILAGCGGSGGKKSGTAPPVPINPEKNVDIGLGDNGCVIRHNADNDVKFLMGDKQARFLLWNCGNHDTHNKQLIRLFLPFDYTLQCYTQASLHVGFGRCTNPLAVPKNPLFNITVANLSVQVGRNPGGLPGFSFGADILNSGNVPAFDLKFEFQVDRNAGGNVGEFQVIEAGESQTTPRFETYSQAFAGRQFVLDLIVRDVFGNLVAGRTASVTVN